MQESDTFKQFHDEYGFVVVAANKPLPIGTIIGVQHTATWLRAPGTSFYVGQSPLPLRVIGPSSREEHILYEEALGFDNHSLPPGFHYFFRVTVAD